MSNGYFCDDYAIGAHLMPIRPQDHFQNNKQVPGLRPNAKNLVEIDDIIDFELLASLNGKSIVSSQQFSRGMIIALSRLAAALETTEVASFHPLDGLIGITAFFEASTRTRLSFESAMLRLDGKVMSIPDGAVSGTAKGETIADIGEMFNAYADIVIMRHTIDDAHNEILRNLRVPLINAGNGTDEHPTQALADWYALLKWRPSLCQKEVDKKDRIHLGIIGTPGAMRTVRSFLTMALEFPQAIDKITIFSEYADPFDESLHSLLEKTNIKLEKGSSLDKHSEEIDVIYINSITFRGGSYHLVDAQFKVNEETNLKKGAVVMHPLARREELATELDSTNHNLYFSQAAGAVYIRQALLISVLGRLNRLPQSINPLSRGQSRK